MAFTRTNLAPDLTCAEALIAASGSRLGSPLFVTAETTSTNDDAKQGAKEGALHGATWLAESQTQGRGRQGRVWASSSGENLLFSVLMRLRCLPARVPLVSLAAGLAVRDAVARAIGDDERVLVKWPNDVLVRGRKDGVLRKVSGILVESVASGSRVAHVIVGVGINVHMRALPEALAGIATSISLEQDGDDRGSATGLERARVLTDVLVGLDRDAEHVVFRGLGLIHARLAKYDAFSGREVVAGDITGRAAGIDPDGRLLVRRADGTLARVISGEVRVRPV